jgi:C4-dicarboxylate transporter, DctM subunit
MWKHLSRMLDHLEEAIIAFLIAGATFLIFIAVVHRYGTGVSINMSKWAAAQGFVGLAAALKSVFTWFTSWDLSWAQELCIFMFVWMAKFGAAYGVRTGVHVGVDVVTNAVTGPSRYWVVLFGLSAGAIFTATIGLFGANFVNHMAHTAQTSNDLEVPMWIVYLAIPLGSFLMCFRFLQVMYVFAKTGELPHTDESHVDGLEDVIAKDSTTTLGEVLGTAPHGSAPTAAGGVR